jgi:hypothetical protein
MKNDFTVTYRGCIFPQSFVPMNVAMRAKNYGQKRKYRHEDGFLTEHGISSQPTRLPESPLRNSASPKSKGAGD